MVSRFGVLVAVAMASGCASEASNPAPAPAPLATAKSPSTEDDAGVDAGGRPVDPGCSSRAGELRSDPPTGSCVTDATCEFTMPTGPQLCERPGVRAYPNTPPQFRCKCESAAWRCNVVGGGFSLRMCPDAGE